MDSLTKQVLERQARQVPNNSNNLVEPAAKSLAVAALKQKRDEEKQVLSHLNDRFVKYLDRVKFLEAQNKKLLTELDELRGRWNERSRRIKEHYEPELAQARARIDDSTSDKACAEIKSKRNEYEAANLKRQYDDALAQLNADKQRIGSLEHLIRDNRGELDMLRKQSNELESDINKYKSEVARLNDELRKLLTTLDKETLRRAKLECEKQTLAEQIPFLNAVHEQEMAELRSLQAAGAQIDPAQFYRHELERAVRDIRNDFDELSEQQKRELEQWYKFKVEELAPKLAQRQEALLSSPSTDEPSESRLKSSLGEHHKELNELRVRNNELTSRMARLEETFEQNRRKHMYENERCDREMADLKARIYDQMLNCDELMTNKASLEFEINTYKRLLDSEETGGRKSDMNNNSSNSISANKATSTTTTTTKNNKFLQNRPATTTTTNTTSNHYQPITLKPVKLTKPNDEDNSLLSSMKKFSIEQQHSSNVVANYTSERSSKGNISISGCSSDCKWITIENTSNEKNIKLYNWTLVRTLSSSGREIRFRLPDDLVLDSNKSIRLVAGWLDPKERLATDIINTSIVDWGFDDSGAETLLFNEKNELRASLIQKRIK